MRQTSNDLPEISRMKVISYLNVRLCDCLDLASQAKQAHWNVKGPNFLPLHRLFDEIAEDFENYSDLIAERLVQLGGAAHGTARNVATNSGLREYPRDITSGKAHIEALTLVLTDFARGIREGISHTNELADADTADILTQISRGVDKWLWMVEAHLYPQT